jgi:hypothetical protein
VFGFNAEEVIHRSAQKVIHPGRLVTALPVGRQAA